MRKVLYFLLVNIMLMTSCIDEFNARLPEGEIDILVVDGSIISDSLCTFYVSRSNALDDENEFHGEPNALVKVKGSDGTEWPAAMEQAGEYKVQVGTLLPEVSYHLEIQSDGLTYTSASCKPEETPLILDSIGIREKAYEADLLVYTTMRGSRDRYYSIIYLQDWEIRAEWNTQIEYDRGKGEFIPITQQVSRGWKSDYTELPTILPSSKYDQGQSFPTRLYSIPLTGDQLSYRYCTTIVARAITQAEYEYEKIRLQVSEQMGGLFTPQPSQLPSNITCNDPSAKVIGFVGVSGNVHRQQYYINTTQVDCLYQEGREYLCELHGMDEFRTDDYNAIYDMGYRVVSTNPMKWAAASCVDVRSMKASLERPAWWKDN